MLTFTSVPYTLRIRREHLADIMAEISDPTTREAITGAIAVFDPEPIRLGPMQIDTLLEAVHAHETKAESP